MDKKVMFLHKNKKLFNKQTKGKRKVMQYYRFEKKDILLTF